MNQPRSQVSQDRQAANLYYQQLALKRLRLLLKRRVLWLKSQWQHDPTDESNKGVISEPHVAWLLRRDNQVAEWEFYAQDPTARELTATAVTVQGEMDALRRKLGQQSALPLVVLAHLFGLGRFECDVLLTCLAPELDPSFQPLFGYVQDNISRTYPTMHLVQALFGEPDISQISWQQAFHADAPLRRYQLIILRDDHQPLTSQPLSLPERILTYLRGTNRADADLKPYLTSVQDSLLTDALSQVRDQVLQVVQNVQTNGPFPVISLVGAVDGGQLEIAAATTAALHLNLFELDTAQLDSSTLNQPTFVTLLEREALLLQCAYFIDLTRIDTMSIALRRFIQTWEHQANALLFIANRDRLEATSRLINVTLPRLTSRDRHDLWQQALGGHANRIDIPQVVQQFRFGPQSVRQIVATTRYMAIMRECAEMVTMNDLWDACRQQSQWHLDDLAQRIEPAYEWDDLVLPPDTEAQLHELAAQVKYRYRVYDDWGYECKLTRGRGISAMFAGVSGTGKTMAAEVLANQLNLPLFRIDLAGVVNKYVGETEKNLRRIFQAAEQSGTILFFDEADALFGKRTDVKDSHDRYANIEVNYLLQLMENYSGLAILATNRRQAIDYAFLRRLRFVVDFVFPNVDTRRRIWRQVFPPDVPKGRIDYNRLAQLEISGGNIHSIALNAAFLAAADGGVVQMTHIMAAARREYTKIDKLEPDSTFGVS